MSSTGDDGAGEQRDQLPPSALYVLDVLEREDHLTRQELLEQTNLSERTLDRAVKRLQNVGYASKARKNDDLSQTTVKLATPHRYNMTDT